ncbi:snare-like protein [Conidiobolus coronatus NRRL 28638]|uniref:Synaptobrevin homolog YKT6 n=1 Tax=Conidiobolus coronatus (strain ATCC 28846 / CBS 209.66 / NRRL 28638) TaxID=796925 RepID=A0A137P9A1_CONC2|nr:snare-like protein [Conidiobolus coronatus NRRL 28638]|eukprot:KXN71562.1 snare-like protein [Conidiobolus coronatus NRRL 28638]
MKIYSLAVFNNSSKPAKTICSESDLSSFRFFERGSVKEFISFFGTTVAERTQPGQRQSVEQENMFGHVHARPEGIVTVMVTDQEYPSRVAFCLLNKLGDDFISQIPKSQWEQTVTFPALQDYLTKYQDPQQADPILRVQKELDETRIVMHRTIESVLERGEKLDNLVSRSEQLSAQSKMFYTSAKKTNSCCRVM